MFDGVLNELIITQFVLALSEWLSIKTLAESIRQVFIVLEELLIVTFEAYRDTNLNQKGIYQRAQQVYMLKHYII